MKIIILLLYYVCVSCKFSFIGENNLKIVLNLWPKTTENCLTSLTLLRRQHKRDNTGDSLINFFMWMQGLGHLNREEKVYFILVVFFCGSYF